MIRVYTQAAGQAGGHDGPVHDPRGGTVLDFAEKVHSDLAEKLKSAKVWGSAQFDGQTVKRDHVPARQGRGGIAPCDVKVSDWLRLPTHVTHTWQPWTAAA